MQRLTNAWHGSLRNKIVIVLIPLLFACAGCGGPPSLSGPPQRPAIVTAAAPVGAGAGAISTPAIPGLTIVPKPLGATTAIPTPTSTSAPTLSELIDAAWAAGDWPQVIALLKRADPVDSNKLYAAYFNYGQFLLGKGDKAGAIVQFQNALTANSSGTEARQAILALTPSPTPTRTTVPLPPTATATAAIVIQPTIPGSSGIRIGAVCNDGTTSNATGRGACSHHGGVAYWLYK